MTCIDKEQDEEENRNEGGYYDLRFSDEEWAEIPEELKPVHEDTLIVSKEKLEQYINKNQILIN